VRDCFSHQFRIEAGSFSVRKPGGETLRAGRGKQVKRPTNEETCFSALYLSFQKRFCKETFFTFLVGVI
jgi:hypothetical protein